MQPVKQSEFESHYLTDDQGNDSDSDIGGLERQKAALEEQVRKLQQVAEYRSAFLARLSHELRTPLTSILGFSEILLTQEELSDAQRSFCERIQNSARQLQASLNSAGKNFRSKICCAKLVWDWRDRRRSKTPNSIVRLRRLCR